MRTQYTAYAATAKIERSARWQKRKTKPSDTTTPPRPKSKTPRVKRQRVNINRLETE
jgi:hypothetical protein